MARAVPRDGPLLFICYDRDMPGPDSTPADRGGAAPETPFQALARQAGLVLSGRVKVDTPLAPIVEQVLALLAQTPDVERQHDCWDGSWSSVWVVHPPEALGRPGPPSPTRDRLPALSALFEELGGTVGLVVIARLAPSDLLDWHYDPVPPEAAMFRLHLPIRTHPLAVTDLCHKRLHWPVGELHFGDYGFPHRVLNRSSEERIHLYFDIAGGHIPDRLPPATRDALLHYDPVIRAETVRNMLQFRSEAAVSAAR